MRRFFNQLVPFVLLGIAMVAFAFGVILFAYLFVFGALIGMILFLISWIRQKFFAPKTVTRVKKESGRVIDSDDWKHL